MIDSMTDSTTPVNVPSPPEPASPEPGASEFIAFCRGLIGPAAASTETISTARRLLDALTVTAANATDVCSALARFPVYKSGELLAGKWPAIPANIRYIFLQWAWDKAEAKQIAGNAMVAAAGILPLDKESALTLVGKGLREKKAGVDKAARHSIRTHWIQAGSDGVPPIGRLAWVDLPPNVRERFADAVIEIGVRANDKKLNEAEAQAAIDWLLAAAEAAGPDSTVARAIRPQPPVATVPPAVIDDTPSKADDRLTDPAPAVPLATRSTTLTGTSRAGRMRPVLDALEKLHAAVASLDAVPAKPTAAADDEAKRALREDLERAVRRAEAAERVAATAEAEQRRLTAVAADMRDKQADAEEALRAARVDATRWQQQAEDARQTARKERDANALHTENARKAAVQVFCQQIGQSVRHESENLKAIAQQELTPERAKLAVSVAGAIVSKLKRAGVPLE